MTLPLPPGGADAKQVSLKEAMAAAVQNEASDGTLELDNTSWWWTPPAKAAYGIVLYFVMGWAFYMFAFSSFLFRLSLPLRDVTDRSGDTAHRVRARARALSLYLYLSLSLSLSLPREGRGRNTTITATCCLLR